MYYNFPAGSFLSKKLCSRLHSIEVDFYSKKVKVLFLYAIHLYLIGKPVYDFLFVIPYFLE